MDWTAIIERFNLQVDDSSELSDSESLALANEVYREIQNDRNWEWLKKEYTGVQSTSVPYIALPTDLKTLSPNSEGVSVVFVWTNFEEYKVIPFSKRREYRDMLGYCYLDIPNSRLVFTKQPTAANAVEFDYVCVAPDLTTTTEPLFKEMFHDTISYWMASKFNPIELTDKAQSYQRENTITYMEKLSQIRLQDSREKLAMS